jgi:hypothetical protein
LYIPFWQLPGYKGKDPLAEKSGLIYQPYWMTNRSRGRLVQRPNLQVKPRSHVLTHLGTDEEDGLGKGFNPIKAITRAVHITPSSFKLKNIMGAMASVTAGVATAGLGPMLAPKVFSANSSTMKTLGMAEAAIGLVAGGVVLAPSIAATMGPMLSSAAGLAGKAVTGLTGFFNVFNKLTPQQRQQQAGQLTAQQIADVDAGRARFDPTTGQLVYGAGFGPQPLFPGSDPRYNPGYESTPISQQYNPSANGGFGPNVSAPGGSGIAEAGMLGGMSPIALGLMIGVPLVIQFLTKKK